MSTSTSDAAPFANPQSLLPLLDDDDVLFEEICRYEDEIAEIEQFISLKKLFWLDIIKRYTEWTRRGVVPLQSAAALVQRASKFLNQSLIDCTQHRKQLRRIVEQLVAKYGPQCTSSASST